MGIPRFSQWRQILAQPMVLAVLSGGLALIAQPPWSVSWAAWVWPLPLAGVAMGTPRLRWGWLGVGLAWAVIYYSTMLAWLAPSLMLNGGVSAGFAWGLFGLALGVYAGGLALALGVMWPLSLWGLPVWVSLPVVLATHNAVMGSLPFGGLPWGDVATASLGSRTAHGLAPLAGGAAVVWAQGLTGSLLAQAISHVRVWRGPGRVAVRLAQGPGLVLLLALLWANLSSPPPPEQITEGDKEAMQVLLVGDNLPIATLGDPKQREMLAAHFLARSLYGTAPNMAAPQTKAPRLVVWPEGAISGWLEQGKLAVDLWHGAGLMDADLLVGATAQEQGQEYNSAYLLTGDHFAFWRYDKHNLVPFGEYVPLGYGWLFPRRLTQGQADYGQGQGPRVLDWRGVRLGVAICLESGLAQHARQAVAQGAQVLVVLANDQWLGWAGRTHHLQLSALRGLEVGRDVVVAANGGYSAHLSQGQVLQMASWQDPPLWVRPRLRQERTPFARWGHAATATGLLLWLALGLVLKRFTFNSRGLRPLHPQTPGKGYSPTLR